MNGKKGWDDEDEDDGDKGSVNILDLLPPPMYQSGVPVITFIGKTQCAGGGTM